MARTSPRRKSFLNKWQSFLQVWAKGLKYSYAQGTKPEKIYHLLKDPQSIPSQTIKSQKQYDHIVRLIRSTGFR